MHKKIIIALCLVAGMAQAQLNRSGVDALWASRQVPITAQRQTTWLSFYNVIDNPASGTGSIVMTSTLSTYLQNITGKLLAGANTTLTGSGTSVSPYTITTSSGGGGGFSRSINTISTNTTAGSSLGIDYYYVCTANATITLPTAIGNTNEYTFKNNGGRPTVNTTLSQTIDGGLTAVLTNLHSSITLYSNNINWLIK